MMSRATHTTPLQQAIDDAEFCPTCNTVRSAHVTNAWLDDETLGGNSTTFGWLAQIKPDFLVSGGGELTEEDARAHAARAIIKECNRRKAAWLARISRNERLEGTTP